MPVTKILLNHTLHTNLYRKNNNLAAKISKNVVPCVSIPLLVNFSLKGSRNVNLDTLKNNAINAQKKLYDNNKITEKEYNSRIQKINDYYNNSKNLPAEVSSNKIKRSEPTFKSEYHSSDGHLDIHDLSDTPSVSEIRNLDVSMPMELQEYMDTPMDHVQSGLITDIFDELPDDFDVDEGLLAKLRGFIEHVEGLF